MEIQTHYLQKCIETLEKSYEMIKKAQENSIEYEMYRNSLVKSFEITLEQAGKLLKKKIEPYFASKKTVDALTFKDLFRLANKYCILNDKAVERWLKYRDNRNNTAHDYGVKFAKETLTLIEDFIKDVKDLKRVINEP